MRPHSLALFLFSIFFCTLISASASHADVYDLRTCLDLAMRSHPDLRSASADVSASEARLKSAATPSRITVNGSLTQGRSGSDRSSWGSSFSSSANASLRIFDAGRVHYLVASARASLGAAEATEVQTRRRIRANIKDAYASLRLNIEIQSARERSVQAYQEHLDAAKAQYDAGTRALNDVTKAEVDLGNARLALETAKAGVANARAELLYAMGVSVPSNIEIEQSPIFAREDASALTAPLEEELIAAALDLRADHAAAALGVDSARASLSAAARQGSPVATLSAGYSGSGSHIGNASQGWSTSLGVSIPIIDGGETELAIRSARAALESREAALDRSREGIERDVRRAANGLRTAYESGVLADLTLANAIENHRLASGRYETGAGSALEVTDALVALTNAYLSKSQAQADLENAVVALESAVGMEIIEPEVRYEDQD